MKKCLVLSFFFLLSFLVSTAQKKITTQKASYYHSKFNGRKTASGAIYSDHRLTAASNTYKLGTRLLVTNKKTRKSVQVVVNDRMSPKIKGRVDLSKSAFKKIARIDHGVIPVEIRVLNGTEEDDNSFLEPG